MMPGRLISFKTTRQRSRRSNAWSVGRPRNRVSKRGSEKRTAAEKREYIRHHRPRGLSIAEGCRLMGLPRSTYYDVPSLRSDDAATLFDWRLRSKHHAGLSIFLNLLLYFLASEQPIGFRASPPTMAHGYCPIRGAEAAALDKTGNATGFDCPRHGRLKVSSTAIMTRSCATREGWEAALKRATAPQPNEWARCVQSTNF